MPSREELLDSFQAGGLTVAVAGMRSAVLSMTAHLQDMGVRSVLEVGCGDCALLEDLARHGFEVTGFEPASIGQTAGGKIPIFPHFDGELPALADGQYDLVILLGTLARLPDGATALKCLREAFRVAGKAVILGLATSGVPNAPATYWQVVAMSLGTIDQRVGRREYLTLLVAKRPPGEDPPP